MNDNTEKLLKTKSLGLYISILVLMVLAEIGLVYLLCVNEYSGGVIGLIVFAMVAIVILFSFLCCSFKVIDPNEALVLTLFGKYYGTLLDAGFYVVNPFCQAINPVARRKSENTTEKVTVQGVPLSYESKGSKKISLKATTLSNEKQKINDADGNPIIIGVVVIWKVVSPSKAVFNVDNYLNYISTQCDGVLRQVARSYPYDISDEDEHSGEKSLRGSSTEIAEVLRCQLQEKTEIAGIEILETRISHISYAPEIAAVMLQRQQASAIISARQKIVEGAVGMVEMALNSLSEKEVVVLDDERKAQMVSNLLVVLCGNKDSQPIVNAGSIY